MGMRSKHAALSVAGFDPGSGAGISADLKTFRSLGVYGLALITCITSQNHFVFNGSTEIDLPLFRNQFATLLNGYDIRSVKTGLLTRDTAAIIGQWKADNPGVPLVCDPVFSATSGHDFFSEEGAGFLKRALFRFADLITPNIDEASLLSGIEIVIVPDMVRAGKAIYDEIKVPVLVKGGHLGENATDILVTGTAEEYFRHERVMGVNTHGSGCILSAAITAYIAGGDGLSTAVSRAKTYMNSLITDPVMLGAGEPVLDP